MFLFNPGLKKKSLFAICAVCFALAGRAQIAGAVSANKYIAFTIADSLLKDANAVMREDVMHFRVKDVNSAVMEVHEIVTVLNEEGRHHLSFGYPSDKFHYLDEAEINVYSALGKKLNTYNKKEMQTTAYGSGLVEDGKTTHFEVTAPSYPITVETKYTVRYKGILDYPDDNIQGPNTGVEHFLYSVEVPNNLGLRYKVLNSNVKTQTIAGAEATTYTWEANNLAPKKSELHNGGYSRYAAAIVIAPNKFKLDDYEGDMSTWKNFGEWNYKLIGNNNKLSEGGRSFIKNLVKDATTDEQKARLIYNYLQNNMRYVSIQLGIGGWRPFPADFVQEKKYGDCKALSNYMQAALDAVNVKSYYAVVNAGANGEPAREDFPASRFDHIILCIPQPGDSIWLECTSNTSDFGELGDFTENRKALLVTENGGVLVNTPASKWSSNIFTSTTHITLLADGTGKAEALISGTGECKQMQVAYTYQQTDDEKRRYLLQVVDWKQPDELTITNSDRTKTPYRLQASMNYSQLPSFKTGSKMFLAPRLYPLFNETIPETDHRTQSYFFSYPYGVTDTTIFHLPEGLGMDNLPTEKNIDNAFGKYNSSYTYNADAKTLTVIANLRITRNEVAAGDYPQLLAFKKAVLADMNEKDCAEEVVVK